MEFIAAYFVMSLLSGVASENMVKHSQVTEISKNYFDFKLSENPWFATKLGIDKYQDKVEDWNHAAFKRRIDTSRAMLTKVKDLLTGEMFQSENDLIGLKIMKYSLDVYLRGAAYRNYTATLNADLARIDYLLRRYPVRTMKELNYWYHRVIALQDSFDDQLSLMDQGIESGLTRGRYDVMNLISGLRRSISNSTYNFFALKPWIELNISDSNITFFQDAIRECSILRKKMIEYTDKMENEYLPVTRSDNQEGVSYLEGGADFYRNTLKYYTHEEMTPELAHTIGIVETKRITNEMKQIVSSAGYNGTVREYTEYLLSQPGQTYTTRDELFQGYRKLLSEKIRPAMSKEFDPVDTGVELEIVDDSNGGIGSYTNPKFDEESGEFTSGVFRYDGSRPGEILKLGMLALLLHESIPGHHYQITYTLKVAQLPDHLRYYDFSHYGQDGFKFPTFTSYEEGWGLYAEYVGGLGMMGVIYTENERFGQLSFESLRAARLVVDTGIHFYNWTRQRAVDYLVENTALSQGDCERQIRRYISAPGQACAYKIGELKLKELRRLASDSLGASFDPREFHNVILKLGPSPLGMVEEEILNWLRKKTTTSASNHLHTATGLLLLCTIYIEMLV